MNTTNLVLHLIPKEFWESQRDPASDISPFVTDALAIERRLRKGVNLSNERARYHLCSRRIQEAASRISLQVDKVTLEENYFNVLHMLYSERPEEVVQSRLASCFFPPTEISKQINDFRKLIRELGIEGREDVKKRLDFFEKALSQGAGIVEIADFRLSTGGEGSRERISLAGREPSETGPSGFEGDDDLSDEERRDFLEILKSRIQKALETAGEVNFSNQPHSVISDALNDFVYKRSPDDEEKEIRVIYMDGSEAEPFPVRCLTTPIESGTGENMVVLKASLISMRHLEMDDKVDFAWFRNRMVSVSRPYAETDAYCTARTTELLKEMKDGEYHLSLYQTGLETAVIGFYRALVQELKERRKNPHAPPLRVVPFYYVSKDRTYRVGKSWV